MFGTSSRNTLPALPALFLSSALLFSSAALAQSPDFLPETVIEAADEQPFNPGTGTLADPNKVPYTLSLQPADPGDTARDALRWDPAISTHTGNGVFDFFTLRGFDSLTAVNVAIDGVVEPETSFYHLHNMEQVQVAKGPFSTYFGRDALAGNVNLVRKQPHAEQDLRLGVEAGSFGHVQVDADLNFPSLTRLNLLYKAGDGYRDDMDSEAYNVTVAQGWNLSDRSDITAHFDFTHNEYTPDSGIPTLGPQLLPGISDKANFQSDGEFSEQDIIRIAVNLETELNDVWSLQNRAYFTDFDWQSSGSIFAGFAKFGAGLEAQPMSLARIRPELDDQQQIIGDNLSFRGDLGNHQVLVGAEVRQLTDEFTLPINPISDINVFTGETSQGVIPPIPAQAGDAELNEYSLYAIDQVRLTDTFSVLGGVRGQIFEFEDSELGTERDDEKLSGSAGLLYRPTEEVSYYLNAGTAYATPSTQVQGPRGEPEESVSFEGGVKYLAADGSLGGSLAAYTIDRDNIAIPRLRLPRRRTRGLRRVRRAWPHGLLRQRRRLRPRTHPHPARHLRPQRGHLPQRRRRLPGRAIHRPRQRLQNRRPNLHRTRRHLRPGKMARPHHPAQCARRGTLRSRHRRQFGPPRGRLRHLRSLRDTFLRGSKKVAWPSRPCREMGFQPVGYRNEDTTAMASFCHKVARFRHSMANSCHTPNRGFKAAPLLLP